MCAASLSCHAFRIVDGKKVDVEKNNCHFVFFGTVRMGGPGLSRYRPEYEDEGGVEDGGGESRDRGTVVGTVVVGTVVRAVVRTVVGQ
eukprot:1283213-Pyramimonas_sp.AAC.1